MEMGQPPAQAAPAPEGQPPAEGGGSPSEAIIGVATTIDEGLGMLNEVISQLPIDEAQKSALADVQSQFQAIMQQIVSGGGQPQAPQTAPGQSPMEGGPSGVPMDPSVRA